MKHNNRFAGRVHGNRGHDTERSRRHCRWRPLGTASLRPQPQRQPTPRRAGGGRRPAGDGGGGTQMVRISASSAAIRQSTRPAGTAWSIASRPPAPGMARRAEKAVSSHVSANPAALCNAAATPARAGSRRIVSGGVIAALPERHRAGVDRRGSAPGRFRAGWRSAPAPLYRSPAGSMPLQRRARGRRGPRRRLRAPRARRQHTRQRPRVAALPAALKGHHCGRTAARNIRPAATRPQPAVAAPESRLRRQRRQRRRMW